MIRPSTDQLAQSNNAVTPPPCRATAIPHACLQDYSLSLDAHAVLLRVLSMPADWSFQKSWAYKNFGVGREKIDRIVKELRDAGYLRVEQTRTANGQLSSTSYTFTSTKVLP